MRISTCLLGLLLLVVMCAPPVYAGTDVWSVESPTTGNPLARAPVPGVVILLTPTASQTTETFRSAACRTLAIETYGATPTVVAMPQVCIGQFAAGVGLDTGECQDKYSAPLDAAADHGVNVSEVPAYMRFSVTSGHGATQTIQVTCR